MRAYGAAVVATAGASVGCALLAAVSAFVATGGCSAKETGNEEVLAGAGVSGFMAGSSSDTKSFASFAGVDVFGFSSSSSSELSNTIGVDVFAGADVFSFLVAGSSSESSESTSITAAAVVTLLDATPTNPQIVPRIWGFSVSTVAERAAIPRLRPISQSRIEKLYEYRSTEF